MYLVVSADISRVGVSHVVTRGRAYGAASAAMCRNVTGAETSTIPDENIVSDG